LERERAALQSEWNRDAIDALKEIEKLGIELESIDPGAISSEEWRVYKTLLDDEKMVITVIKCRHANGSNFHKPPARSGQTIGRDCNLHRQRSCQF
jgi:hypothetical protein